MRKTAPANGEKMSVDPGAVAFRFMAFLAADESRLERFCALSGMLENGLREALPNPEFQGFLLDYALQDESLLLAFAAEQDIDPAAIATARRKLPGATE